MNDIATIPYVEAEFDKNGSPVTRVALPAAVTDLFVISHGWNNDANEARGLYTELFTNFVAVGGLQDSPSRRFGIVGVIWPSKKFDELVAASGVTGDGSGAAAISAADKKSRAAIEGKIERLKTFFADPAEQKLLDEAKALLPDIEDKSTARKAFVDKIRKLLDRSSVSNDDASKAFFADDGNELMKNLKVDEADLDEAVASSGGGAALPLEFGSTGDTEGAAKISDIFSGFKAAVMNVLNYTTYYEMKSRAGKVGANGVAPLLDSASAQVERIHLVGHSFGGRVVTAAAANSTTNKIRSMTLLQAAFSHNGFSKNMHGFFRTVVDQKRVAGPILVTHTKNDKAVGVAYPLASRINGDRAAKLGDENDVFGGIGRNGAQKMEQGEVIGGSLLAVGSSYTFASGKFSNLEASAFIKSHGDVRGREVAYALRRAIA